MDAHCGRRRKSKVELDENKFWMGIVQKRFIREPIKTVSLAYESRTEVGKVNVLLEKQGRDQEGLKRQAKILNATEKLHAQCEKSE